LEIADAAPQTIVQMMFGQTVQKARPPNLSASTEPVMQVQDLGRRGQFHHVSFTLHKGEILGIAGMLGSGRTELLRAIFGAEPFDHGRIVLEGREVGSSSPAMMKKLGLALTPENRKEQGLVQGLGTRINACLASMDRISSGGLITRWREQTVVRRLVDRLGIRLHGLEQPVRTLSGGNQQKIVVGKWLNTQPRVILFDEPTRGIDVQAKQQVFQIMWDLSRQGISSVFVSSELEELVEVCHRILVMKKGTIVGEVLPDRTAADELFVRCMEP
jgi:ribose transport system ATP-binding protein